MVYGSRLDAGRVLFLLEKRFHVLNLFTEASYHANIGFHGLGFLHGLVTIKGRWPCS